MIHAGVAQVQQAAATQSRSHYVSKLAELGYDPALTDKLLDST
jgi:hypothetical protein